MKKILALVSILPLTLLILLATGLSAFSAAQSANPAYQSLPVFSPALTAPHGHLWSSNPGYVTNPSISALFVLDVRNHALTATVPLTKDLPTPAHLALHPRRQELFLSGFAPQITQTLEMSRPGAVIDTQSFSITHLLHNSALDAAYTCNGDYLATLSSDQLHIFETLTYTQIATVQLTTPAFDLTVSDYVNHVMSGTLSWPVRTPLLYASHPAADAISVIDGKDWAVTHIITSNLDGPRWVRFSRDGKRAFVLNTGNTSLATVDTLSHTVLFTTPLNLNVSGTLSLTLGGVDLSHNDDQLYGSFATHDETGGVYRFDTSTLSVTAIITDPLFTTPGSLALTADGTYAYVPQPEYIVVLRTSDLSLTHVISLPLAAATAGSNIALQPDCRRSWTVYLPLLTTSAHPHGPSKLGAHTIRPDGVQAFLEQVAAGGAQVAIVKALDDFGYLRHVQSISPDTVRIARSNLWPTVDPVGSPVEKAQEMMEKQMSIWALNREHVDYWEILNEPDPPTTEGHVWLAEFFIACMEIAEANGYKLALFSYSVGVPEWEEWEAIVATGVFSRAKQGGHILSLHEYGWPTMDARWGEALPGKPAYSDRGVLAGRYRHLYRDFLIPRNQVIPLAITECGFDPSIVHEGWDPHWKERYIEEVAWYDDRLREDDYVIGCALFTLGPIPPWTDWDYSSLLDNLADHIILLRDE